MKPRTGPQKTKVTTRVLYLFVESVLYKCSGEWSWDLPGSDMLCSDVMPSFTLPENELIAKALIHPDDLQSVLKAIARIALSEPADISFRIITTYGKIKKIRGAGQFAVEKSSDYPLRLSQQELQNWEADKLRQQRIDQLDMQSRLAEHAEQVNDTGTWYYNTITSSTWYSDEYFRIFRLSPQTLNHHLHTFHPFIHDEDRDTVVELYARSVAELLPVNIEYRIVRNDLSLSYVRDTTRFITNQKGELLLCGALRDISDWKEAERTIESLTDALEVERQKLRFAERIAHSGSFEVNTATRKVTFSDGMYHLLGLKPGARPAGINLIAECLSTDDRESALALLRQDLEHEEFTPSEFHIVRPDGRKRHIKRTGCIVRNKDNEAILLGILQDVTDDDTSNIEVRELETQATLLEFIQGLSEPALDSAHWIWNLESGRIRWSDNFFRLLGYKSRLTEFTHDQLVNHVHAADRPAFSAALKEMLHEKKETVLSFRYSRKNEIRFARAQFRLHTATGANYFIGLVNDITAMEHLEQSLKEQVSFNDIVSNSTVDRILITDQNHNITLWNRQFETTYGWKKEKVVGKNFFEVFPELHREEMRLHLKQALSGDPVFLKDHRLTGTKNIVTITLTPVMDHEGGIKGVLHIVHDNTREYALREELTQRLNFIEKLLEASVDRIIVLDQHMNYVYWNKRAEKHYGLHKEDVTGRNILEVYPALANEPSYSELRRCLRGETIHIPAARADDDQKEYFETYLIPLRDERRNVTGILWIVHDLADEYRLARQQRKAGSILESISEAYLEVDFDGKVRYMNPQAEEMWSLDKQSAFRQDIFDLLPDEAAPGIHQLLQKALEERRNLHGELFRPGNGRWLDLSCTVNDEGMIMLFYDITETKLAAEKLKESNLFIEQVTVALPDLISIHDSASGDVLYMNRKPFGEKYHHGLPGLRKSEDPASITELIHADDRGKVLQWLQERNGLRSDETAELEYRLASNEWIRTRSRVFKSAPDGRPTQLLSISTDITGSKKAELEIRAGKELLQGIIDAPNIGIAVYKAIRDEEGHIIDFVHEFINRRTLELIGMDMTGELLNDNALQGTQQMDRFIEALETGRPNSYAVEAELNGGLRWMLFSNAPIDSERLVHVWEDVTQLRRAEMEMEKQSTLLKHTEESVQSGSWEYDIQTAKFTWSDGMYKLFGLPRQMNVRPETYLDFVVEQDRPIARRIVSCLRKKHESFEETMSISTQHGVRQLQIKASVLTDKDGRPQKFVGIDLDITNLWQVEKKLKESRLWLEHTSLASPDSISVYDVQKKQPVYLNNCLANWLGTTSEHLVEIGIEGRLKVIHGDDRLRLLQFNEKMMTAQDSDVLTLEYRIIAPDGRVIWLLNRTKVLARDEQGKVRHFLTVLQDVTESVQMREELKHRTRYAEAIIDASIDRIAVYDRQLKVLAWNRRAEEITGRKKDQVLGRKLFDIFPAVALDEELLKAHLDALEGNYVQVPVRKGIYTSNIYERFFIPMKDAAGNVYAIINIMHDVSELAIRNMELSDLNKTLDQRNRELAQKNEEITHFSFVASHDMKEPLRKIHTFSDWLLQHEHDKLSDEGKKFVGKMNTAVRRMEALIEDILVLTNIHSDRYKEEEVNLEHLLARVLEDMADEISEAKAEVDVVDELPVIRGNTNQVFYLFKNLVTNAIKFQHAGSTPKITVGHRIIGSDELPQAGKDEEYYMVSLADNGFGFEPKYYKKIFQVFQRLHSVQEFEGTGIGLAICKQIMQNHEGFITVESEPEKGSTFYCFFPVK